MCALRVGLDDRDNGAIDLEFLRDLNNVIKTKKDQLSESIQHRIQVRRSSVLQE